MNDDQDYYGRFMSALFNINASKGSEMREHTPLPWHFYELPDRNPDGCGYIRSEDLRFEISHHGDTGRSRDENLANAELIVRAVNAHDQLIAALEGGTQDMHPLARLHWKQNAKELLKKVKS